MKLLKCLLKKAPSIIKTPYWKATATGMRTEGRSLNLWSLGAAPGLNLDSHTPENSHRKFDAKKVEQMRQIFQLHSALSFCNQVTLEKCQIKHIFKLKKKILETHRKQNIHFYLLS